VCYSAQIWADFKKYRRFGGALDIEGYVKLAGWARAKGVWVKSVPKAMRNSFMEPSDPGEQPARDAALAAYQAAALDLEREIAEQTERLVKAEAVLASPKPTKKAETDRRVSTNKIAAARARLAEVGDFAVRDGYDRIWPGHFAPLLIRDPATGERRVVPARYRCRLPGWTEEMEREKPGTYNARRDKLSTVWRPLFGRNHGIVVASRFYESVSLHRLQRRELVPGERDIPVEVEFQPEPAQDMLLACLWRYVESEGDEPGFYTFAAITREPPPEILAAGHDRCIIAIRPEHIDAWLDPDPKRLGDMLAILDDPVDVYYQRELVQKDPSAA
jgi:putative SOS response-associated peptidase YedK